MTLNNKGRKANHKLQLLPDFLSEETLAIVNKLDQEADEIIKEGKIEDVIFYFDRLNDVEKQECIQKLQSRLNE